MKPLAMMLFALLWAVTAPAATQDGNGLACDPQGSQMELNTCAALQLSAADDALNATWREVLAQIGNRPMAIAKLKAAQRLWIQLRDADMEAQFPLENGQDARVEYGSIYPMEFANAKAKLTRERAHYLRATWLEDSAH